MLSLLFPFKQIGWNTTPKDNDSLLEYILEKGWTEIKISRDSTDQFMAGLLAGLAEVCGQAQNGTTEGGKKRTSSTRKYICPRCKMSVRATRKVNIMCGDCHVTMETEDKD